MGEYYGVDPIAIRSDIDILTNNARCAVCIESEEFGQVLFVAIGASEVGTVLYVAPTNFEVRNNLTWLQ